MERFVLFDIDGTLMNTGGAGRRSMRLALQEVFGTTGPVDSCSFCGKTDSQIILELMTDCGLDPRFVEERLTAVFTIYIAHLRAEMARRPAGLLLYPGVEELFTALSGMEMVTLGLLTGNIEKGARIKLDAFNLNRFFLIGAFGDDSFDRRMLPEIARSRAHKILGKPFHCSELVIIGDTPHDIDCGRKSGAKSIAVATGMIPFFELEREKPNHLFSNFADYQRVVEAIIS